MVKYRLCKAQIRCLLKGKPVVDGRGRKFYASEKVKETLQLIDSKNAYDKFDIFLDYGCIDIIAKAGVENGTERDT